MNLLSLLQSRENFSWILVLFGANPDESHLSQTDLVAVVAA